MTEIISDDGGGNRKTGRTCTRHFPRCNFPLSLLIIHRLFCLPPTLAHPTPNLPTSSSTLNSFTSPLINDGRRPRTSRRICASHRFLRRQYRGYQITKNQNGAVFGYRTNVSEWEWLALLLSARVLAIAIDFSFAYLYAFSVW